LKTTNFTDQKRCDLQTDKNKSVNATAIEAMSTEHRHIESVVKSLQDASAGLENGRKLRVWKLRTVVEFLRVYAGQRHHSREEALYFSIYSKCSAFSQSCPFERLHRENEKASALVSRMENQIAQYEQQQPEAGHALGQTLQEIAQLYLHCLWMENAMDFSTAKETITEDVNRQLQRQFSEIDSAIGWDLVAEYEQFAANLSFRAATIDLYAGRATARVARSDALISARDDAPFLKPNFKPIANLKMKM
jgi:hemerythrin-like domain-containing protein